MKRSLLASVGWLSLLILALIVAGGWTARASAPPEVTSPQPRETMSAPATICGVVSYSGVITGAHIVWVGAFTTTLGIPPAFSTQFLGVGPYTLTVQPGAYYLYGGMDGDDSAGPPNPQMDPMGAYPGNPISLSAGETITGADIALVDPDRPLPGSGSISGQISYAGQISPLHTVIVVAMREGEQEPAYHAILPAPGPYTMNGVISGAYLLLAFMDVGENMGPPEPGEPFGYYDPGGDGPDLVSVGEESDVTGIDILLRDPQRAVYLPLALKK